MQCRAGESSIRGMGKAQGRKNWYFRTKSKQEAAAGLVKEAVSRGEEAVTLGKMGWVLTTE